LVREIRKYVSIQDITGYYSNIWRVKV
jgi:hypothetical protein